DAARIAAMGPDMVAVEPPELIGGDISISTGRPGLITETVEAVRKVTQDVPVLCGAGVSTTQDVRTSLQLGAKGVLLASGVMKADDPAAVLTDLVEGTR
ncbi:MAG: triose-phosphate isomerase, partial [Nanoarchaeota archaeon]